MKLRAGTVLPTIPLVSILGNSVSIPDRAARFVHLQFRRFAGCPVCNFHLHSLSRRFADIKAAGICEVAVFHSSREEMLKYQAQLPFDCIADPGKALYRQFGVEASLLAPGPRGEVVAAHYGTHAYDNWDADYLLGLRADLGRKAFTSASSVST